MEVENEIRSRSFHIRNLFDRTVEKTNIRLNDIKKVHDGQIKEIFDILKTVVTELEKSDVLKQGEYNFTDSVFWKMNFENINSDKFSTDLGKSVVDKTTKTEQIENRKKREWSSLNPFFHPIKRYKAKHMDDYETVIKYVDGYYETTELCKRIDTYYIELERERSNMEETFKQIIENSKKKVRNLVDRVLREVNQFLSDIKTQKEHIETMGDSIEMLNKEIAEYEKMLNWLNDLKEKIKGE